MSSSRSRSRPGGPACTRRLHAEVKDQRHLLQRQACELSAMMSATVGPNEEENIKAEPWWTFKQDATVWASWLRSHCVDPNAMAELFLLAQHSADGFHAASSIMWKIAKKTSGNEPLGNPSAFVHACVRNGRKRIEADPIDGWWVPKGERIK